MSKWAEQIKEFDQLVTPDGQVYDLTAPSKQGRWVLQNQGWGMPGIEWITQQSPFQHGATVMDYRLQPRVLQLMVRQNFCSRDDYWAGREALINALRPNRTPVIFNDYWAPRSQFQPGGIYPSGGDQYDIRDLEVYNGLLYGCTGADLSGTGGILLVWDGSGSWVNVAAQASAINVATEYATALYSLLAANMEVPVWGDVLSEVRLADYYNINYDSGEYLELQAPRLLGQCFTPSQDYVLAKVRCALMSVPVVSDAGQNVWCKIYETSASGLPTGDPLAVSVVAIAAIGGEPANLDWVEFGGDWRSSDWSNPNLTLQAGKMYCLVLEHEGDPLMAYANWFNDIGVTYAGGDPVVSLDGGTTWVNEGYYVYLFEVWGRGWTTGKVGEETKQILLAGGSVDGIVGVWDGAWQPGMGALQYGAENVIYEMIQRASDDKVYCATGGTGLLLEYAINLSNGRGALTLAADAIAGATAIYCLADYDDGGGSDIYGGSNDGRLLHWDGTDGHAWAEICAAPGAETDIYDLVVHNGFLYGCTGPNGYLVRYDVAGGHWDVVSQSLGKYIHAIRVFRGRLYGAGEDGHLYRWDDDALWQVVCEDFIGQSGLTEEILCLEEYNTRFLAGTEEGAYLLEWVHERLYTQPLCTSLRRLLSNGNKRDLCVYLAEGPSFDPGQPGWDAWAFTEMLRFVAYDPVMYDPDAVSVPYLLGTGYISEYEDILYAGTWETHPVMILTGPLDNPRIINETLDEYVALDYEIPDGDTVTIDLAAGTVADQDNQDLLGALTPDSKMATFRLAPTPEAAGGTNRVRLVAGGAGANSDFEIQYFTRYIGI